MQGFELNRTNRLQLINLAPTNLLELLLVGNHPKISCQASYLITQLCPGQMIVAGTAGC